jgi:hypothetical protein
MTLSRYMQINRALKAAGEEDYRNLTVEQILSGKGVLEPIPSGRVVNELARLEMSGEIEAYQAIDPDTFEI